MNDFPRKQFYPKRQITHKQFDTSCLWNTYRAQFVFLFFFGFGQLCKMPNKIFMLIAGLFEFIQWAIQLILIPLHKQNPLLFTSHKNRSVHRLYFASCITTCLVFTPHTKYNSFKVAKFCRLAVVVFCWRVSDLCYIPPFCFNITKQYARKRSCFLYFSLTELFSIG